MSATEVVLIVIIQTLGAPAYVLGYLALKSLTRPETTEAGDEWSARLMARPLENTQKWVILFATLAIAIPQVVTAAQLLDMPNETKTATYVIGLVGMAVCFRINYSCFIKTSKFMLKITNEKRSQARVAEQRAAIRKAMKNLGQSA